MDLDKRIGVLFPVPQSDAPCGVRDYVTNLADALDPRRFRVVVARMPLAEVGLSANLRSVEGQIMEHSVDIVHIQYPMAAYGASLLPHLLIAKFAPTVGTLHEFSHANLRRKISAAAFLLCRRLLFTNEHELQRFNRWYPLNRARRHVIPIGSNVPVFEQWLERNESEVVFFGLIRPHKGLEEFLEVAAHASSKDSPLYFRVVGKVPDGQQRFCRRLQREYRGLTNLVWELGLPQERVAERLARAGFAYLWYPDGASKRRGSLLAALCNGVAVITNCGAQTPQDLEGAVEFCEGPKQVLGTINGLIRDPERLHVLREAAIRWAAAYSWSAIAQRHAELYESVAG